MKRKLRNVYLLLCAGILSVLAVTNAQAQERPRVGFKGGLNLSNLYVGDADEENARVGWHAGFYTQLFSSEAFAIQPEINYSTKGTGITYVSGGTQSVGVNYDQRFNLAYLDIPVLAVFKLGRAAEIHAGPYWSYLLRAEIKNNDGNPNNEFDTIDRRNFDDWDYGLVGGIGFNLGKGAQLGARYNYGLNPIADSGGARRVFGNAKNQVAQLYLSINLNAGDDDIDDDYDYDY
ncbi:MAG TPA: porin family protein [Chryseosolibacter sp.]|nr:porin family protein [Chryseosolibacter sp.]